MSNTLEQETFFRGDDWEIPFQYTLEGDPYDITTISEIEACLKAEDGTSVSVTLTGGAIVVSSAVAGKGTINFDDTITPLVKKGIIDLVVTRTQSDGKKKTNVLEKYLVVSDKPC